MATVRRAALACRSARRLLSTSASSSGHPPALLGHFHHPMCPQDPEAFQLPPLAAPAFQPLNASSPRLSLDFLPDILDYALYDSHLGLLLLRRKPHFDTRGFIVCDPVSRRHALLPPPPVFSLVVGAALLSRAAADPLRFELLCVTLEVDRPRAWIASYRDGRCHWAALATSRGVTVDFDPRRLERVCVHAAGGIYWHALDSPAVLALDTATMEFCFLPAPAMMWGGEDGEHKYRIGEMPEDGRLCVASLEMKHGLQLCVREETSGDNGWVLERRISMEEVLDTVSSLPRISWRATADCGWVIWMPDEQERFSLTPLASATSPSTLTRASWSLWRFKMARHMVIQCSPTHRVQTAARHDSGSRSRDEGDDH